MQAQPSAIEAKAATARRTLIRGADLLTMDPALGELPDTDVLIDDGRIIEIGRGLDVVDAEVVDARETILMPGMIDGHRHVWDGSFAGRHVMTDRKAISGLADTSRGLFRWLQKAVVCFTAQDHYLLNLVGGLQALDSGVTSVLDHAGPRTIERAVAAAKGLRDSGIGGWYGQAVGQGSLTYGPGTTIASAQVNAEYFELADDGPLESVDVLQKDVFTDSDAPLQLALCMSGGAIGAPMDRVKAHLDRIRSYGVGIVTTHNHRPAKPHPAGHFGARGSGILDLKEAGLLGPDFHLSHGNGLTEDELAMLRDTGGMICSTVKSETAYRERGLPGPVHGRARRAGVAVGIGIDVGSSVNLEYFEHVRTAFLSLYLDPEGVEIAGSYTSADTLEFATGLGAGAIRMGDETGTLTVGKRADLVLLRTDRVGFPMLGSLADQVLGFATSTDIDSVWANGRRVKQDGRMVGVDWPTLKGRVREIQERVEAEIATITFTG